MQRFLELFCCNWDSPSQDIDQFDGGLLSHSLVTLSSSSAHLTLPEDEEIVQNACAILGQVNDPPTESMKILLYNVLDLISQASLRMAILSRLFDLGPKSDYDPLEFIIHLVATLEDKQRNDLATIINDLPPAVLGDSVAKQQSRVLIDLSVDVKDSLMEDKYKLNKKRKLLDTLTDILQQSLLRYSMSEREQVLLEAFDHQPYVLKLKSILQQLFASQLIGADQVSREMLAHRIITG